MAAKRFPDPRVMRTREAVVRATALLLEEEGIGAVTHQRVAERAAVGRATVYRHWPRPEDLVIAALAQLDQPLLRFGDLPLRPWLITELHHAAAELSQPLAVHVLAALVTTARLNEAAAELRAGIFARMVAPLDHALDRALAAGELAEKPDPSELVAQALGPVLFRVVMEGAPVSDDFVERVADAALEPWSATVSTG